MGGIQSLLDVILNTFINPIIQVVFALGILMFMWGLFEFMRQGPGNPEAKSKGQQHMIWGVIGVFIMVAVWGIIGFVANTLGLQQTNSGLWE
jgi:hypothetical protein